MGPIVMATGCMPQPMETRVGFRVGYTGTQIKPSDYESVSVMRNYVPRGKSQGSVPACNIYTTGKCFQTVYAMRTGKPYPQVSYCAMYQEITHGDFEAGTLPIDAIRVAASRGFYPVSDDCPEWFNQPRRIAGAIEDQRHTLRTDEWEEVRTREDLLSAIMNNDPVDAGIDWYREDVNPGPKGRLGVRGSQLLGGHSVEFMGVVMGYDLSPSRIGVLFNNHHGDSETPAMTDERGNKLQFPIWGDDGFGIVPIERLEAGIPKYGAWAMRSVMIRSADLIDVPTPRFIGSAA